MRAGDRDDPNAAVLDAIERELEPATDAHGRRLRLLALPSPGRVVDSSGAPIAASYLNFYMGNRVVIVPAFESDRDEQARRARSEAARSSFVSLTRHVDESRHCVEQSNLVATLRQPEGVRTGSSANVEYDRRQSWQESID